jgi:hypothetical protein
MKASEFFKAKAEQHKDERFLKIASVLEGTENDFEVMTKVSSILPMLTSAGKTLISNPTLRNAAIGAGTGAVASASNAQPGGRISAALKGAAVGGAVGGLGTIAANTYQASRAGIPLRQALQTQGQAIKGTLQQAANTPGLKAKLRLPATPQPASINV